MFEEVASSMEVDIGVSGDLSMIVQTSYAQPLYLTSVLGGGILLVMLVLVVYFGRSLYFVMYCTI